MIAVMEDMLGKAARMQRAFKCYAMHDPQGARIAMNS